MNNVKVKPLTKEQLTISIDRLTRFKNPEVKYLRVFGELITNNLIQPKYKKSDIEKMDSEEVKNLAELIINYSLENLGLPKDEDYIINQRLYDYEKSVYIISENIEKFLKALGSPMDIKQERFKNSLRFPVEKVVIAEGATEETLLPEFAKRCGYDFDKEGIYVLSAGGKNQVVKLYYRLVDSLKLPIFVLLDKDAKENLEEIKPKLRPIDKIHLLACGEFEDLLPLELVQRTLDYQLNNISMMEKEMLNAPEPRVKILEEVFKTRGMHEFKKVEFAQMVKKNIKTNADISDEICEIINEIKGHGELIEKI